MYPEIWSVVGVFVSGILSWLVSRSSASREIKRLRLEWEREDVVTSEDDFSEMAGAVSEFIRRNDVETLSKAARLVGQIRAKETGKLGECLDTLFSVLSPEKPKPEISLALSAVIDEKRKRQSRQDTGDNKKQR